MIKIHTHTRTSWKCFPATCHYVLLIYPWFTDTQMLGRWNLLFPFLLLSPAVAGLCHSKQISLCQAPSSSYKHKHVAPLVSTRKQWASLEGLFCPLGTQLGVPEYQTQVYSNVTTNHFDSTISYSSCHLVLPTLFLLFTSSDNSVMTLCALK